MLPWAPFWAVLAAVFQFIPHFGPVLTFFGPATAALIDGGLERFLWVLGLYGVIIVVDGLILQPLIMRRTAKIPIWASLTVPIVLSLLLGFWGCAAGGAAAGGDFCLPCGSKEAWRRSRLRAVIARRLLDGKSPAASCFLLKSQPFIRKGRTRFRLRQRWERSCGPDFHIAHDYNKHELTKASN